MNRVYSKKLNEVGEIVIQKLGLLLEGIVGRPTKLSQAFEYKIVNNELLIYATSDIITYLEKGTKPHIIKPKKPGGSLAFTAGSSGVTPKGRKYQLGEKIIAKQVKHPGIEARPFISAALFASKPQIIKVLAKDSNRRGLRFYMDGNKIWLVE